MDPARLGNTIGVLGVLVLWCGLFVGGLWVVFLLFFCFCLVGVFLVFGWWVFCLCLGVVALGNPSKH